MSQSFENICEEKFVKGATTLDFNIVPEECPSNQGLLQNYFKLTYGKPDRTVVRKDLIRNTKYAHKYRKNREKKKEKKIKKRIALATFVQITDVHIIDSTSPARDQFLSLFVTQLPILAEAFRPYEAFSTQVADCMVRKINAVRKGPHLGQEIALVISCGDSGDGEQKNELQNFINNLDGTKIVPNPASPGHYVGVQDDFPADVYVAYYHPNPPPPSKEIDRYKRDYGYPEYPNILNVAARPFKATGLRVPWYSASGNHDKLKLGAFSLGFFKMLTLFDQLATGNLPDGLGSKLIESMTPFQAESFVKALQLQDADAVLNIIKTSNLREVPRSNRREHFTPADFVRMHFNTTLCPGPVGHGFTHENIENNTLYYTFKISDKVTGITLDSCNPSGNLEDANLAANGSFGRWQIAWLEKELRQRHSSYYNDEGQLICTNNKDELILLFCHHTIETLNNNYTSPTTFDNDPQRILNSDFLQLIHRYPNIIALVNGHEHRNKITPFPDPCGRTQGIWEINTASHIDYPQESRIIEIAENSDDTISIFTTIIDHASPANVHRGYFPNRNTGATGMSRPRSNCCETKHSYSHHKTNITNNSSCEEEYTIEEIASISRELSYNDPFIVNLFDDGLMRTGTKYDRNTELLLFNPLKRC